MRALMLTADYPGPVWSGIGAAVASQAAALVEAGVDVHVLAPARAANPAVSARRGPVVHRLSADRCPVRPAEFDVLHLHSLSLSDLACEMRRRFRVPLVYTAHSLLDRELPGVPGADAWRRLQRALMLRSDHVVFLSADERAAVLDRLPSVAERSSVVPNGVAALPPGRPSGGGDDGPVVFAGRFARTKGIDLLAMIVRRLAGRYRFVLAGGHGDAHGHRITAALAADCGEACRAVGWLDREALDRLFAGASLVLIPSEYEPFGLVALEAMRAGAPVLAAGVGGLVDVAGPESGGRLVYSRDPRVWCAAIDEILGTPALRRELRRRGPAYVALRHDPVRLARRLVDDVYRPLCEVA